MYLVGFYFKHGLFFGMQAASFIHIIAWFYAKRWEITMHVCPCKPLVHSCPCLSTCTATFASKIMFHTSAILYRVVPLSNNLKTTNSKITGKKKKKKNRKRQKEKHPVSSICCSSMSSHSNLRFFPKLRTWHLQYTTHFPNYVLG